MKSDPHNAWHQLCSNRHPSPLCVPDASEKNEILSAIKDYDKSTNGLQTNVGSLVKNESHIHVSSFISVSNIYAVVWFETHSCCFSIIMTSECPSWKVIEETSDLLQSKYSYYLLGE